MLFYKMFRALCFLSLVLLVYGGRPWDYVENSAPTGIKNNANTEKAFESSPVYLDLSDYLGRVDELQDQIPKPQGQFPQRNYRRRSRKISNSGRNIPTEETRLKPRDQLNSNQSRSDVRYQKPTYEVIPEQLESKPLESSSSHSTEQEESVRQPEEHVKRKYYIKKSNRFRVKPLKESGSSEKLESVQAPADERIQGRLQAKRRQRIGNKAVKASAYPARNEQTPTEKLPYIAYPIYNQVPSTWVPQEDTITQGAPEGIQQKNYQPQPVENYPEITYERKPLHLRSKPLNSGKSVNVQVHPEDHTLYTELPVEEEVRNDSNSHVNKKLISYEVQPHFKSLPAIAHPEIQLREQAGENVADSLIQRHDTRQPILYTEELIPLDKLEHNKLRVLPVEPLQPALYKDTEATSPNENVPVENNKYDQLTHYPQENIPAIPYVNVESNLPGGYLPEVAITSQKSANSNPKIQPYILEPELSEKYDTTHFEIEDNFKPDEKVYATRRNTNLDLQEPQSSGSHEVEKEYSGEVDKTNVKGETASKKPSSSSYVNRGGVKYHSHKMKGEGNKERKGYKSLQHNDHSDKGKHEKDLHKGLYDNHKGREHKDEDHADHYSTHQEGSKGHKGGKFGEKKGHKRGHKTKGYHNKFYKDEYHKEHKFYDNFHAGGHHSKHGDFNAHHEEKEGGHHGGKHHKSNYDNDDHGKEGGHDRGHDDFEHKGKDIKYGHEEYDSQEKDYGKKGAGVDGKSYGYKH